MESRVVEDVMEGELRAAIFYSGRFVRSANFAEESGRLFQDNDVQVSLVNIDYDSAEWNRLGLKSLPAIVFYSDGSPISNMVSYAKPAQILDRLAIIRKRLKSTNGNERNLLSLPKTPIPFYVEASSGAHRYTRWHEDFLTMPNLNTGWCAPSVKGGEEYVLLHLRQSAILSTIELFPRYRSDGTDSHKSFPKGLSVIDVTNESERVLWSGPADESSRAASSVCIDLEVPVQLSRIKLRIDEKHDMDGKSFPSLCGIRLWGWPLGRDVKNYYVKPGFLRRGVPPEMFVKHGIFSNGDTQVEQFNLKAGQRVPASTSNGERVVVVLNGHLKSFLAEDVVELRTMDALVIDKGDSPVSLEAVEDSWYVLIYVSNSSSVLWEAR